MNKIWKIGCLVLALLLVMSGGVGVASAETATEEYTNSAVIKFWHAGFIGAELGLNKEVCDGYWHPIVTVYDSEWDWSSLSQIGVGNILLGEAIWQVDPSSSFEEYQDDGYNIWIVAYYDNYPLESVVLYDSGFLNEKDVFRYKYFDISRYYQSNPSWPLDRIELWVRGDNFDWGANDCVKFKNNLGIYVRVPAEKMDQICEFKFTISEDIYNNFERADIDVHAIISDIDDDCHDGDIGMQLNGETLPYVEIDDLVGYGFTTWDKSRFKEGENVLIMWEYSVTNKLVTIPRGELEVSILYEDIDPPVVTTNAATSVEETTATLYGVINSDGGEACQYRFEYDTNSGEPYAYSTSWTGSKTTGQSFNQALSSLNKGTKYYFRAQAKNSAGTASGSELTFLTKPDAPTSFGATSAGTTQIDLSWSKGAGAQKTKIQRKTGSYPANKDDGTQVYFDTGSGKSDTGLSQGTTYYYRAWSYVQGSEQWSDTYAQAAATTTSIGAPTVITNAATSVEETTATLNGIITSDGGEACQYRFEYDTNSGEPYAYSTGWTGSKTSGQSFNQALSSLNKGTKYYFRAQAKNSAGTASGSELTFLTKPDAPTSFSATAAGTTQIDLSWSKGVGAQKTKVQRKTGSYPSNKDDGTQVYFDTGSGKSDTGLSQGTTYYYRAWSYVQGSELWSDSYAQAAATTTSIGAPTVITNAALDVGTTSATLNGYLNDTGGETCDVWFEYGKTTSYGSTTPTQSKSSTGSFSTLRSNLDDDTTYHFRAVASNTQGTRYGLDRAFKTDKIGNAKVSINPAYKEVRPGESFSLGVHVDSTELISAGSVRIEFDTSAFTVDDITPGDLWTGTPSPAAKNIDNLTGVIQYDLYTMPGTTLKATGTFAVISIAVKETAVKMDYTIDITDAILSDENYEEIPDVVKEDGVIRVEEKLPGDVDRDCDVDFYDLLALLEVYNSQCGEQNYNPTADFDDDCDVGFSDLLIILQHYGEACETVASAAISAPAPALGLAQIQASNVASGTTNVFVNPPEIEVEPTETFTVNISVDSDESIGAGSINISFNSTVLTAEDIIPGDLWTGTPTPAEKTIDNVSGSIKYDLFTIPGTALKSTGNFAVVTFTVKEDVPAGEYPLEFREIIMANSSYEESPVVTANGTVTIPPQDAPRIVSYTITNRTIIPPQTTEIDLEFSEQVEAWIKIEDASRNLVNELYHSAGVTNPTPKTWEGTYGNGTQVPDGVYTVNVTGTSTTTGLSVVNNTETITVTSSTLELVITQAKTDKSTYALNEDVKISCNLQNETGYAITADSVDAEILKPDSSIEWVKMTEGLVGHYTGTFANTSLNSTYNVTIHANKMGYVNDTSMLWFEVVPIACNDIDYSLVWNGLFSFDILSVFIGDADSDYKNDIFIAGYPLAFGPSIYIFEHMSDDNYLEVWNYTFHDRVGVAIASFDADKDGRGDIVAGSTGSFASMVHVFENNGDNAYVEIWNSSISGYLEALVLGDTDKDGLTEIIIGGRNGMNITIYENIGDNNYAMTWSYFPGEDVRSLTLGDPDGDGKEDIIVGVGTFGSGCKILVFENTDDNKYSQSWSTSLSDDYVLSVASDDTDGDGKKEIVAGTGYNVDIVYIFETTGDNNYTLVWQSPVLGDIYGLEIGDSDSDGNKEIIAVHGDSNCIYIFENNGDNSYIQEEIVNISAPGANCVISGDPDNDYINNLIIGSMGSLSESLFIFENICTDVYKLEITNAQTDKNIYNMGENVIISCIIQNEYGLNITADNVTTKIIKPDNLTEWITLSEDLTGNYIGTFVNTSLAGTYKATIYANKTGYVNDTAELSFFGATRKEDLFDTGKGNYPSISGTHNGTLTPSLHITVSTLYTYPGPGTGGHTEYIMIWNSTGWNVIADWNGYVGDWHNITFDETFTLYANETYNFTIRTGSYPQIRHTRTLLTENGWINCTSFVDANGRTYDNWIPAIRLCS